MKVLIADDSQIMRKIIKANLAKLGIDKVLECADGVNACKTLIANPDIKLLFTDLNMPTMNGFELIKQLRNLPKLKALEIIVISDKLDSSSEKALEPYGIKGCVPKPFNIDSFNSIAVPIVESLQNSTAAVKKGANELKSLLENETPTITLDANGLVISFQNESFKATLENLSAVLDAVK